jgi:acyl carrier protein
MSEHTSKNNLSSAQSALTQVQLQALYPEVLVVVRRHLIEVMELEEGELEIEMATHFQDDLELESIEMIALGDALRAYYLQAERAAIIDFAHWLTQLSIEQLMELTVGDLVTWIAQELVSLNKESDFPRS